MEVEVLNEAGAKVGDRIMLHLETVSLLKVSFLLYIFPILLLILGAAIGHALSMSLEVEPSALAALLGFCFFLASFLFIRSRANRLAKKNQYQPKIIKIIAHCQESAEHG
jgi:sigma-E factor negative regulatory protein RseC